MTSGAADEETALIDLPHVAAHVRSRKPTARAFGAVGVDLDAVQHAALLGACAAQNAPPLDALVASLGALGARYAGEDEVFVGRASAPDVTTVQRVALAVDDDTTLGGLLAASSAGHPSGASVGVHAVQLACLGARAAQRGAATLSGRALDAECAHRLGPAPSAERPHSCLELALALSEYREAFPSGARITLVFSREHHDERSAAIVLAHARALLLACASDARARAREVRLSSEAELELVARAWPSGEVRSWLPGVRGLLGATGLLGAGGGGRGAGAAEPAAAERPAASEAAGAEAGAEAEAESEAGATIHGMMLRQAARTPAALAVRSETRAYTYAQLDAASALVGGALAAAGVGRGGLVALLLRRSAETVAAIYGVLRAGGAYVPIDAEYPAERMRMILDDTRARTLLAQASTAQLVPPGWGGVVLTLEELLPPGGGARAEGGGGGGAEGEVPQRGAKPRRAPAWPGGRGAAARAAAEAEAAAAAAAAAARAAPPLRAGERGPARASDLVYVFFTSGTTGRPKGTQVEHRGLVGRTRWLQRAFALRPSERVLHKTPYVFGVSEWELFWAPTHGAVLQVAPPEVHRRADELLALMRAAGITVAFFVPSHLSALLDAASERGAARERGLRAVRAVLLAGEGVPGELVARYCAAGVFPSAPRLHNLYGPTEADMTHWACPDLGARALDAAAPPLRVLIGRPIECTTVRLLRWGAAPGGAPSHVALGELGEICFCGEGVARGYVGRPELSAAAFLPNPFGRGRLYRTGDLARWLPSGQLEFAGRRDSQVKLRGFRIELGEVEAACARAPGVSQVAVLLVGASTASHRLVAYVTAGGGGRAVRADDVRQAAARALPAYMVPSAVVVLRAMPLTHNGKLDRKALPPPPPPGAALAAPPRARTLSLGALAGGAAAAAHAAPPHVPPRDELELAIHGVWQEALETAEEISVRAEFVALGGNSLLAGRVATLLRARVHAQLQTVAVYNHETIEALAAHARTLPEEGLGGSAGAGAGARGGGSADPEAAAARAAHHGAPPRPPPRPYHGHSSSAPAALLVQGATVLASVCFEDVAYYPAYYGAYEVYARYGRAAAFAALPAAILATVLLGALLALLLKWALVGAVRPGQYPLWGAYYLRWWAARRFEEAATESLKPLLMGTPLLPAWYRALGATIGPRVELHAAVSVREPDMLRVGADAVVGRAVSLGGFYVQDGLLVLRGVEVGARSVIGVGASVPAGTSVPPDTEMGAVSTSGGGANVLRPRPAGAPRRLRSQCAPQALLRVALGLPLQLLVLGVAFVPCVYALEAVWAALDGAAPALPPAARLLLFGGAVTWVLTFVYSEALFALVVAVKWGVVGRFREGPAAQSEWELFRHWLMELLVFSRFTQDALEPWGSLELLSCKLRLLGATIGRRVQIDNLQLYQHDLLTVEDSVTFGAYVHVEPMDAAGTLRRVTVRRRAAVLDNCALLGGADVGEGAVVGTTTIVDGAIAPRETRIGNAGGKSVYLTKSRPLEALPPSDPATKAARAAWAGHTSWRWHAFQAWGLSAVLLVAPLTEAVGAGAVGLELALAGAGAPLPVVIASTPLALAGTLCAHIALHIGLKWAIIGRMAEGDFPFYSAFHARWVLMLLLNRNMVEALHMFSGSAYCNVLYRALGARVGRDACLFELWSADWDMLEVGERAAVTFSDLGAHTVEHLVLRIRKVHVGDRASVRTQAGALPGARVEAEGTLLELATVLKGETVGPGETWAGSPAQRYTGPHEARPLAPSDADQRAPPLKHRTAAAAAARAHHAGGATPTTVAGSSAASSASS